MQGPPCAVQVRQEQQIATLRIEGRINMNSCPAIGHWADACLAEGVSQLRVDLSRCSYMDSTFVGTLLSLYRRCKDRAPGTFALVAPSPPCAQVLRQMHLLEILNVLPQADTGTTGWTTLPLEPDGQTAVIGQVVQAHQELAALPGEVGQSFRGIAEELSAEMPNIK